MNFPYKSPNNQQWADHACNLAVAKFEPDIPFRLDDFGIKFL